LSYHKDSLQKLFAKMITLRENLGWKPKKKLDDALKEWWKKAKLEDSLLNEALNELYSMET